MLKFHPGDLLLLNVRMGNRKPVPAWYRVCEVSGDWFRVRLEPDQRGTIRLPQISVLNTVSFMATTELLAWERT